MKMKVMMFVLNDADLLSPLLKELNGIGIRGCTIFDSNGMGREIVRHPDDFGMMFGTLRSLLKPNLKNTKTLMMVIEESKVETAVVAIEKTVGSLEEPGTGILFTFALDFVKGLKL